MKRLFLLAFVTLFAINSFAQLKVLSNGNVGIGTTNPGNLLQLGHGVNSDLSISTSTSNKGFIGTWYDYVGFSINRSISSGAFTNANRTHAEIGFFSNDGDSYIRFLTSSVNNTIGTERMRIDKNGNVGIATNSPGSYKLYVNGTTFCNAGVWSGSDKRFKKNIKTIDNALYKISKLNGVNYEFKKEEFKDFNFNEGTNLGFIAQELIEVIPEAVKIGEDGYYSINYDEIIPVLVEAIKEQQKQIETLKEESVNNKTLQINSYQENSNALNETKLFQNTPNPFTENTFINCYLPKNVVSAKLCIYNLQGIQIKCFNISERGNTAINIKGNELSAGIYPYVLITDGTASDTRQMILTK